MSGRASSFYYGPPKRPDSLIRVPSQPSMVCVAALGGRAGIVHVRISRSSSRSVPHGEQGSI